MELQGELRTCHNFKGGDTAKRSEIGKEISFTKSSYCTGEFPLSFRIGTLINFRYNFRYKFSL